MNEQAIRLNNNISDVRACTGRKSNVTKQNKALEKAKSELNQIQSE